LKWFSRLKENPGVKPKMAELLLINIRFGGETHQTSEQYAKNKKTKSE